MAKKGNGNSVVNLGAGAIDLVKRIVGSKIGSEMSGTGSGILGAAAGSKAARGLKKGGVVGKKGT